MAINQVNNIASSYVSQVQPQPQSGAERAAENTSKKSSDDAAKAAAAAASQASQAEPKPTVNTQGQTVGSVINVKA